MSQPLDFACWNSKHVTQLHYVSWKAKVLLFLFRCPLPIIQTTKNLLRWKRMRVMCIVLHSWLDMYCPTHTAIELATFLTDSGIGRLLGVTHETGIVDVGNFFLLLKCYEFASKVHQIRYLLSLNNFSPASYNKTGLLENSGLLTSLTCAQLAYI